MRLPLVPPLAQDVADELGRDVVHVDDDANYGDVMHVMDICRGAGAKVLGIMTK